MNDGVWDDEKRKALKKLQTSKVITKMTDMNQDLRLETTEIVTMAVEKYCSVGQYEVSFAHLITFPTVTCNYNVLTEHCKYKHVFIDRCQKH